MQSPAERGGIESGPAAWPVCPPAPAEPALAGLPLGALAAPLSPAEQQRNVLASAAVFAPLAAHRLLEYLAMRWPVQPWSAVALHLLPPLAMLAVSLLLWRVVRPLPGLARATPAAGHRGICIAAGMLLGALAAAANLLAMLAGSDADAAAAGIDPATSALVLHILLLAPLAEEVAFRGVIYRHLRQFMVPGAAALSSAIIFSLMHATISQALWAVVLGLLAALAYESTRSLVTPVLIHTLFNAVPIGVAVARARPTDLGPIWFVLGVVALVFTFAARSASKASQTIRS